MKRKSTTCRGLALGLIGVIVLAPVAFAQTVCDTPDKRVDFTPTVDPTSLNNLLSRLGTVQITPKNDPAITLPGLCTDHQISLATGNIGFDAGSSPFMVTPGFGTIQVALDIPGPFQVGFDGGNYQAVNCASVCVVDIPYLGELFNGCEIEQFVVEPVLSLLHANVSWDQVDVVQVADTCVLNDCTAVHPLEFSNTNLVNFDVDLTGFGSCGISFPPPLDFLGSFDPCDGIDPLIAGLLEPVLEDLFGGVFVNRQGAGTLVKAFSFQIVRDGCFPIQEVKDCRAAQTAVAGTMRAPNSPILNAFLYLVPLGFVGGLSLRVRRKP